VELGKWNCNVSLCFWDNKWFQADKDFAGTYGWRQVTYVADVPKKQKGRIFLGIRAAGRVWFDDVKVEKVGTDVAVTPKQVLAKVMALVPKEDRGKAGIFAGNRGKEANLRNSRLKIIKLIKQLSEND